MEKETYTLETCNSSSWALLLIMSRHPRVQLHMLKDLFGGDAMVENVKIVPDRNVQPLY